jgi:hypothetical protein
MNKKHLLIMLLCCVIPIAVLGGLYLFQGQISPTMWLGFMLLCPVLHLVMMKFMLHGEDHGEHHATSLPSPRGNKGAVEERSPLP